MPKRIFAPSEPLVSPVPLSADCVDHHLKLHSSHWRPDTLRFHRCYLRVFLKYLLSHDLTQVTDITPSVWSDYCTLRREQVSQTVCHHDGQVVRLFLKECVTQGWIEKSPLEGLKLVKLPSVRHPLPSLADLNAFLTAVLHIHDPKHSVYSRTKESPQQRAFYSTRNHALFLALIVTAARIGELLDLTLSDIDTKEKEFLLGQTKTHKARSVPYAVGEDPVFPALLAAYLKVRPKVDSDTLFIDHFGNPLTYNAWYCIWRRARKKAKVELTPHALRRYALTKLYLKSGDFKSAMMLAGHESTQTAARYQERDMDQLKAALSKANLSEGIGSPPRKKII